MQAVFYTFSKKLNSTAQPTGGDLLPVVLKNACNVLNPRLELKELNPTSYNMFYLEPFRRYYRVTDWTYENGVWVCDGECDVLASWKNEILSQSSYVKRSYSAVNPYITDKMYPTTGSAFAYGETSNPFVADTTDGLYILGILSQEASLGAVDYYAFTTLTFRNFLTKMMGATDWLDIDFSELSESLVKALVNPMQYFTGCYFLPITPPSTTFGTVNEVKIGWWKIQTTCRRYSGGVNSMNIESSFTAKVPKHPETNAKKEYLNRSPYSRYWLNIGAFGDIAIDSDFLISTDTLYGKVIVDITTGTGRLELFNHSAKVAPFLTAYAQIGVPVQLAQLTTNLVGTATSVIGGAASGFVVGGALGAVAGAEVGLASGLDDAMPQVFYSGNSGSYVSFATPPRLRAQFFTEADNSPEHFGYPLGKTVVLGTLSGYTETGGSDIKFNGFQSELNAVNNFLDNGVFIE